MQTPLKGLVRCVPCGCAMTPSFAVKNRGLRYRYYVCCNAQRRGWRTCPSKSLPAVAIERFTLQCVRGLPRDAKKFQEAVAYAYRHEGASEGAKADEEGPSVPVTPHDDDTIQRAQAQLASAWEDLAPEEQVRILRMVVARVDYDGVKGQATLTYQAAGLFALVEEWSNELKETAP